MARTRPSRGADMAPILACVGGSARRFAVNGWVAVYPTLTSFNHDGAKDRQPGADLLDMRAQWRNEAAFAVVGAPAPAFGRRKKSWRDFDLIVDLSEEPLSLRWWQGAATL